MEVLLDTHTFIWFINDDLALSHTARQLIEDEETVPLVSIASVWEMAIKVNLGKLNLPTPFAAFITEQLTFNQIGLLNIGVEHTGTVATIPLYHRDPFDRIIIAQALIEKLPIVGKDDVFDKYGVQRHW